MLLPPLVFENVLNFEGVGNVLGIVSTLLSFDTALAARCVYLPVALGSWNCSESWQNAKASHLRTQNFARVQELQAAWILSQCDDVDQLIKDAAQRVLQQPRALRLVERWGVNPERQAETEALVQALHALSAKHPALDIQIEVRTYLRTDRGSGLGDDNMSTITLLQTVRLMLCVRFHQSTICKLLSV